MLSFLHKIFFTGMLLSLTAGLARGEVPELVRCAVLDKQTPAEPATVRLSGFLGARLDANEANRLVKIDENRLLDGFCNRPGRQAWEGEHVGKWLHAATLAWNYTQDPSLLDKLDRVVAQLERWQLDDGYLGTYLPAQRWTEWDVWAHKYDMIGLLTYYRYTGNTNALEISRRCADLLCETFGTNATQRDILEAGWHVGMAPTSVLEPMVLLYRYTGEKRYLDFCRYILAEWETPNGPKIVSTLLKKRRVDKVGNGKAYEMLSCLNGMLEFYRTTGEPQLLEAALIAWEDIVGKRLYLTGTASHHEHLHDDFELPNGNANVGETCVTVTWIQFNAQLLRLTGEARFADELERAVYNQLLGAQKPDGSAWGYYVQLEGTKPYASELSGNCCLSSGPRGVALIPTFACATDGEGVEINFLEPGQARLALPDGTPIRVDILSHYPAEGRLRLHLGLERDARFELKIRIPEWSQGTTITVNGMSINSRPQPGDYVHLQREWRDGDNVGLLIPMTLRAMVGEHGNQGKVAFAWGPLILAADNALNPDVPIGSFSIPSTETKTARFEKASAPESWRNWAERFCWVLPATLSKDSSYQKAGETVSVRLAPFAYAGCTLSPYQVWLPLTETKTMLAPQP